MPQLNQIHEETEEGSPAADTDAEKPNFIPAKRSSEGVVPFGAPSGAAVMRRLEQRRRKGLILFVFKEKIYSFLSNQAFCQANCTLFLIFPIIIFLSSYFPYLFW